MEYKSPLQDDYYNQPSPPGAGNSYQPKPAKDMSTRYTPYSRNSNGSRSNYGSRRGPHHSACVNHPGPSTSKDYGTNRPSNYYSDPKTFTDNDGPNRSPNYNSRPSSFTGNCSIDEPPKPRYMDQYRQSYPKELTQLFEASHCKLCEIKLSSPIVAKTHYTGKQHQKKITKFLTEWCLRTGSSMPQIGGPVPSSFVNALTDYCELCEVKLITDNDKLLHYTGKTHRKNATDPDNAKKKKKAYDSVDLSNNRFGIGSDFSTGEEVKPKEAFVCEMCDVKAVSQDQLQAHLEGKKHKEKMEKKDLNLHETLEKAGRPFKCVPCNVSLETEYLYNLHVQGKRHMKTLVKLDMDESGTDFCELCNLSFTSADQYQMHIQGKKHEKKFKETFHGTTDSDCCDICNLNFTSVDQYEMHIQGKKHQKNCKKVFFSSITNPVEKLPIVCKNCPYVGNDERHKCDKSLAKLDLQDLDQKRVCSVCHNVVFDSEEAYNEHKNSRRHLLCVLYQEERDSVVEEIKHFYCYVCKKQCSTNNEFTNHLFEPKHMSLSSAESGLKSTIDLFQCNVCDEIMDLASKQEHMKDKKHLKQSLKKDTLNTLKTLANENIDTTSLSCTHCDVTLNSFAEYSEHVLGDEHMDSMVSTLYSQWGPGQCLYLST